MAQWYKAGNANVSSGGEWVVGISTYWNVSPAPISAGDVFTCAGGNSYGADIYEILEVDSAYTAGGASGRIKIYPAWRGATLTGQTYGILPGSYRNADLAGLVAATLRKYHDATDKSLAGKFSDGTAASPGISFSTDQDSGIRRAAENSVAVVTSGTDRITVGSGVQIGAPAGSDKGAGSINAQTIFLNGEQVTTATFISQGLVELATTAETQAGTDATRAVTPAGLAAWPRTGSVTVTVGPSGADYTTINGAISALCQRYPGHGATAIINVAVGFVLAEQVLVRGQSLGWITIAGGADATTPRSIQTSAITTTFDGNITALRPVFGAAFGGALPIIACPFAFDATTPAASVCGLVLTCGASAVFLRGIKNTPAGGNAAYVGSTSRAYLAGNWSGGSRAEGLRCVGSCYATGNWRSSSDTDASTDIFVSGGGIVFVYPTTQGGISQTKNTITSSGIIFDQR